MNIFEKADEVAKSIIGVSYGKKGTKEYNHWYLKYRIAKEAFIKGFRHANESSKTEDELDREYENRKSMGR